MSGSKTVLSREINLPVSAGQSQGLKVARVRLNLKKAFLVREVRAALEEVAGVSFTVSCLEAGRGTSGRMNVICFQRKKWPLNLRVFSHNVILDLSMPVLKSCCYSIL